MVLCTGNAGKVAELRALLPQGTTVLSLAEAGLPADLPENGDTLAANAIEKAAFAHARCGLPCLADDTGLEVDALGGAPGVYSARYAGPARDPQANMQRLLGELAGKAARAARFRTVMAWVDEAGARTFEGAVEGSIAPAPRGAGGFGYDPVFQPLGEARTFAEMSLAEKNRMSHRARALALVAAFLRERYGVR
jgi:XTP/dITP diphosphohydrolase